MILLYICRRKCQICQRLINGALTEFDESDEENMDVSDIMNELAVEVSKRIDIDISEKL